MRQRLHILGYLRVFEAVARVGQVRAAATELSLTPGAVSQQLRKLQDMLGVPLFDHVGRRLELTEAGEAMLRAATTAFAAIESCLDRLGFPDQEPAQKSLTVAVPPALGMSWLTPFMFEFRDTVGLESFQMQAAAEAGQIDWRSTDVAVVYGNPPWKGHHWRLLASIELGPVCSPVLLNDGPPLRSAGDLRGHVLLHEDQGDEWRRWMAAAGVRVESGGHAFFGTVTMAMTAALEGKGLALVSDLLARDHLRTGRLVRPFETRIPASRSYYCLCAENRAGEPLIRRFMERAISRATGAPL